VDSGDAIDRAQEATRLRIGPPRDVFERMVWGLLRFAAADPVLRALLRGGTQDSALLVLAEKRRLRAKLDAQWAWFDANPDHEETDVRTKVFARTLAKFERAESLYAEAREALRCPSR
jgi:hypothetical protein